MINFYEQLMQEKGLPSLLIDTENSGNPDPEKTGLPAKMLSQEDLVKKEINFVEPSLDDEKIDSIIQGYLWFMGSLALGTTIPLKTVRGLNITSKDVAEFSKRLVNYESLNKFRDKTTNYLTALMMSSPDTDFELDLRGSESQLRCLGYKLSNKNLVIKGNVGSGLGYLVKDGIITLHGNAGEYIGFCAKDSTIIVNGNVGSECGECAKSSRIIINGNAGDEVGKKSKDCRIYIKGVYGGFSSKVGKGTKIFQNKDNNNDNKYELLYSR